MKYSKGLHLIVDLETDQSLLLIDFNPTMNLLLDLINYHNLSKIGEIFHNFEGGGFTGVLCLSESHISIHTWPEFGKVTYDVFLSNFRNQNDAIVRDIHNKLSTFFNPTSIIVNEILR